MKANDRGKLLATFICIADLGTTYVYEKELVETFIRDPTETLRITAERAEELIGRYRNSKYYVEVIE